MPKPTSLQRPHADNDLVRTRPPAAHDLPLHTTQRAPTVFGGRPRRLGLRLRVPYLARVAFAGAFLTAVVLAVRWAGAVFAGAVFAVAAFFAAVALAGAAATFLAGA